MEKLPHLTGKYTSNPPSGILILPNELLIQFLSYLPTLQLVRLCTICRRFHSLILYIIHRKTEHALNPDNYYVDLKCPLTSEELYFDCGYLKTLRVDEPRQPHRDQQVTVNSNNTRIEAESQHISNFGTSSIGSLYSHFSLTRVESWSDVTRIALPTKLVSTWLSLDENELFTNLYTRPCISGTSPHYGLPNLHGLFDEEEILVKREWLRDAEKATSRYFSVENIDMHDTISNEESDPMCSRILWFDRRNIAGVKLRVRERKLKNEVAPVLIDAQYEPAAIYELYFEALLIRTVHLLMAWEWDWEGIY